MARSFSTDQALRKTDPTGIVTANKYTCGAYVYRTGANTNKSVIIKIGPTGTGLARGVVLYVDHNSSHALTVEESTGYSRQGGSVGTNTWSRVAFGRNGSASWVGVKCVLNGTAYEMWPENPPTEITTGDSFQISGQRSDSSSWFLGRIAFAWYVRNYYLGTTEIERIFRHPLRELLRYGSDVKLFVPVRGSDSPELDLSGQQNSCSLVGSPSAAGNPPIGPLVFARAFEPKIGAAAVSYEQEGFRFYDDDASEGSRTALAAQDTDITRAAGQGTGVRILTDVNGDPPSKALKLQWRKSGWTEWRDVEE